MPTLIPDIKAVSFLPFNVPFLSDHGSMYADFHTDLLLLGINDIPIDIKTRKLITNHMSCRDKYVDIYKKN
eukprot:1966542-Ditylum_brightwellii.AAC.1